MLYDIESQIKDFDDESKLARRQSLLRHVLDQIDVYLSSEEILFPKVLPKGNLGIAAKYVRRHWTALTEFIDDVGIPLDNSECEQLMKREAMRPPKIAKITKPPNRLVLVYGYPAPVQAASRRIPQLAGFRLQAANRWRPTRSLSW